MKKKDQDEIIRLIIANEGSNDYAKKIIKNGMVRFSIRFGFLALIFMITLTFKDRVSKLSRILHNTLFPNTQVFGPTFFYIFISLAIVCSLAYIIFSIIYKKKNDITKPKSLKVLNQAYNLSDIIVFSLSVITYVYFLIMFVFTPCNVEGASMNNTFADSDKVIVYNFNYSPKYDDVVIFDANNPEYGNNEGFWIKRVKGVPGMTINYVEGYLVVNEETIKPISIFNYLNLMHSAGITGNELGDFLIPDDKYLLIGDNRTNSLDSAYLGLINKEDIVGKTIFRIYPLNKIGYPAEADRK